MAAEASASAAAAVAYFLFLLAVTLVIIAGGPLQAAGPSDLSRVLPVLAGDGDGGESWGLLAASHVPAVCAVDPAGWYAVYRLFLIKVPIVQEMMGLRDVPKAASKAE